MEEIVVESKYKLQRSWLCSKIDKDVDFLELLNDFWSLVKDVEQQNKILKQRFRRYSLLFVASLIFTESSLIASVTLCLIYQKGRADTKGNSLRIMVIFLVLFLIYFGFIFLHIINFKKFSLHRRIYDCKYEKLPWFSCTENINNYAPIMSLDRRDSFCFLYKNKKELVITSKVKCKKAWEFERWLQDSLSGKFAGEEVPLYKICKLYLNQLSVRDEELFFEAYPQFKKKVLFSSKVCLN